MHFLLFLIWLSVWEWYMHQIYFQFVKTYIVETFQLTFFISLRDTDFKNIFLILTILKFYHLMVAILIRPAIQWSCMNNLGSIKFWQFFFINFPRYQPSWIFHGYRYKKKHNLKWPISVIFKPSFILNGCHHEFPVCTETKTL